MNDLVGSEDGTKSAPGPGSSGMLTDRRSIQGAAATLREGMFSRPWASDFFVNSLGRRRKMNDLIHLAWWAQAYVGLATGVAFAYLGHRVTCVDNDPEKLSLI